MSLFLMSSTFDGLADWLAEHTERSQVAVVTNASAGLADADAIVHPAFEALERSDFIPIPVEVTSQTLSVLQSASAVVMTGGNPFRLLEDLRATGAADYLRQAWADGLPVAGQSAGAMVCGPTLRPVSITSPFTPPRNFDFRALELTDRLVLPHQDRPGRAALHREAARAWADSVPMDVLWDDEALHWSQEGWTLQRGALRTRPATIEDAVAVAEVYQAAARAAWGSFLGHGRLAASPPDPQRWSQRIEEGGERFLVNEDAHGISGFSLWGPATDADLGPLVGEVSLLYTHPRAWGTGTGRRLLERATWNLLAAGYQDAVLWTEYRNERALAVYQANGWWLDGRERTRDYLGVPIRELRHRVDLGSSAGGEL